MMDYMAGEWGVHVALGWQSVVVPSFAMAISNALITLIVCCWIDTDKYQGPVNDAAQKVAIAFSIVMLFMLHNQIRTSHSRWCEGGAFLQKARREWFNAYSSIISFTAGARPGVQVDAYCHLLARLMSLLMCCALQQVTPSRDKPYEIIGLDGIDPDSINCLNTAPDKVEIIFQWIQRSMILNTQSGVIPIAPPIVSRAFHELSRGTVELQNARQIADNPYPFPLAHVSMILQILHWATIPIASALALPPLWAVSSSFVSIFVLWCVYFNSLDLECRFASRVNDLTADEFQREWNKSICALLDKTASRAPAFAYDPPVHDQLPIAMSDASNLCVPEFPESCPCAVPRITVKAESTEEPVDEAQSEEEAKSAEAPAPGEACKEDTPAAQAQATLLEEVKATSEPPAVEIPNEVEPVDETQPKDETEPAEAPKEVKPGDQVPPKEDVKKAEAPAPEETLKEDELVAEVPATEEAKATDEAPAAEAPKEVKPAEAPAPEDTPKEDKPVDEVPAAEEAKAAAEAPAAEIPKEVKPADEGLPKEEIEPAGAPMEDEPPKGESADEAPSNENNDGALGELAAEVPTEDNWTLVKETDR